jgi:hypothetical protein
MDGKVLAYDLAADELVFIDPPTGTGTGGDPTKYASLLTTYNPIPAGSNSYSTSLFATKGNIYTANKAASLYGVNMDVTTGQQYRVVVAKLSNVNPGLISEVLYSSGALTGTSNARTHYLPSIIEVAPGDIIAVLAVIFSGTDTTSVNINFPGAPSTADASAVFTASATVRFADITPSVGESIYYDLASVSITGAGLLFTHGSVRDIILNYGDAPSDGKSYVRRDGTWQSAGLVRSDKAADYTITEDALLGNRLHTATAAVVVTVPPSLTGMEPVTVVRNAAGAVSFAPGAGVTIRSADGKLKLRAQYSSATLIPQSNNTYLLVGDLAL